MTIALTLVWLGKSLTTKVDKMLMKEFKSLPELWRYKDQLSIPLPPWTKLIDRSVDEEWRATDGQNKMVYLPQKRSHVLGTIFCRFFLWDLLNLHN